jgi:hypothetical protein
MLYEVPEPPTAERFDVSTPYDLKHSVVMWCPIVVWCDKIKPCQVSSLPYNLRPPAIHHKSVHSIRSCRG